MTGLFDKFKEDDSEGSEMVEERQAYEENEPETTQSESVESLPENEYRSGVNEVQDKSQQST